MELQTTVVSQQLAQLSKVVQAEIKDKDLSADDLFIITMHLMTLLRGVKGLSGPQKKRLVLDVLDKELSKIEGNEKLVGYVRDMLPAAIEAFILIAKQKRTFKAATSCSCFR